MVSTDDWLHCDQAPHRTGVACIQGLVNMVDVGPHTGLPKLLLVLGHSIACLQRQGFMAWTHNMTNAAVHFELVEHYTHWPAYTHFIML